MTVAKVGHSSLMNISGRRPNDIFMASVVLESFSIKPKCVSTHRSRFPGLLWIIVDILFGEKKLNSESFCYVGKSRYVIL